MQRERRKSAHSSFPIRLLFICGFIPKGPLCFSTRNLPEDLAAFLP